jgi:hypothetical protein
VPPFVFLHVNAFAAGVFRIVPAFHVDKKAAARRESWAPSAPRRRRCPMSPSPRGSGVPASACEVLLDNNDVSQILRPSERALEPNDLIEIQERDAVDDCRRGDGCFRGRGVALPIELSVDLDRVLLEKDPAIALFLFSVARRAQRGV